MPNGTEVELGLDSLRAKYAELSRKYAVLVERLERRATQDLAVYRLGSFGLRITGAALVLIVDGQVQLANARFSQLARSIRGELIPVDPRNGPSAPDLRSLVLDYADRLVRSRKPAAEVHYRDTRSDALLSLRFERNPARGGPVVSVVAEDVSEHAQRDQELMKTREPLLQRERLRVLGELAASIAHDLGNTLRGASFQLATLREDSVSSEKRAEAVSAVAQRVEIASDAIARMHNFARTGSLGVGAVKLDRIVEQAAKLVDIDFRSAASPVTVRIAMPELPPVRGSVAELSLLFVNLLRNARDAMPEGGTVSVTAQRNRRGVVVTVADQGTGIAPDVSKRLFEPFFSTKGSRGSGLGLWLAAGTMERLGGTIRAANRPRRGAMFTLEFPSLELSQPDRPRISGARRVGAPRAPSAPAPRRTRRARRT
jgi:C4-dicarboxylate-specific signal transduction histidine kinase